MARIISRHNHKASRQTCSRVAVDMDIVTVLSPTSLKAAVVAAGFRGFPTYRCLVWETWARWARDSPSLATCWAARPVVGKEAS